MLHILLRPLTGRARVAPAILLFLAAVAPPASAQPADLPPAVAELFKTCGSLQCEMEIDWKRNNLMLGSLAQIMPEDLYEYKPTDPQESFGQRVMHVATWHVRILSSLGGKTPTPEINTEATSKAEILEVMQKAHEYGLALIQEFGEEGVKQKVETLPIFGGTSSRQRLIYFLMTHCQDTYGQLVVYLRLNGITPPLSANP